MTKKALLVAVLILGITSVLNAAIVTVKQDGTGDFTTIQEGINAAPSVGDTVLVWPGVYYENIIYNGKHITVASLYITNPADGYIHFTIIDGNHNGTCVTMNGGQDTLFLNGFTIRNGLGYNAGGIFINDATGVVKNCIIKQNTGTGNQYGGGISIEDGSGTVSDCTIEYNTGRMGGGIYTVYSQLSISGTTVKHNHAQGPGGGIYCGHESWVQFDPDDKCDLFLNYGSPGTDFYKFYSVSYQSIIVDTFTINNPDHYYIASYDGFGNPTNDVTIQLDHAYLEPVDHDLYINPISGDDSNSGLSINDPLKTIAYAYILIKADSLNPHNIFLSNGIYSPSTSNEKLPFGTKSYVSLLGESKDSTIIDADSLSHFIHGMGIKKNLSIENITFQHGKGGIYIRQTDYVFINDITLKNGVGGTRLGFEFGDIDSLVIKNTKVEYNKGDFAFEISHWGEKKNYFSIENCVIDHNLPGNSTIFPGLGGGGIEISGQSDTAYRSYGKITNLQITNNTRIPDPEYGEGMTVGLFVNRAVKVDLINASIGKNVLIGINGFGTSSAIYAELNIYNSILFDNYLHELAVGYPNNFGMSTCRIYNSDIEGGEIGVVNWGSGNIIVWGSGNIDNHPLWDTTAVIPYSLPWNSPCVNTGTPVYEFGMQPPYIIQEDTANKLVTFDYDTIVLPPTDLAGNLRIMGGRIDMGAYECQDTTTEVAKYKHQITKIDVEVNPNPFYANTFISFDLNKKAETYVIIYDLMGNEVKSLVDVTLPSGKYNLAWGGDDNNGQKLSNGIYMITLIVNGKYIAAKKVVKKGKR